MQFRKAWQVKLFQMIQIQACDELRVRHILKRPSKPSTRLSGNNNEGGIFFKQVIKYLSYIYDIYKQPYSGNSGLHLQVSPFKKREE